ncbi:MAG: hypothetical protein EBZ75_14920, partial [Oxalobacteraceae bacterium]|nr:hypothetical protein [Oxalobacteraceae bacterium]
MSTTYADEHNRYAEKFKQLRLNRRTSGGYSPHKVCMLLAVLDMARAGILRENRIAYDPALLERYKRYFDIVKGPTDHANPYFPFFHLTGSLRDRSPSFWHLQPKALRGPFLQALKSARHPGDITENVEWATLDPELHQLIQDPAECDALSVVLSTTWFDRTPTELEVLLGRTASISRYERVLRGEYPAIGAATVFSASEAPPAFVRSQAFRRVVIEAYDYRCAASGERIISPTGEALVEAAHIHPFSESGDDDPKNGIALSRDMHWAMDRNLIAPGPDYKWHVSKFLDPRIPDLRRLCQL